MNERIDVIVLSPHFDDAVLSCGGRLHRLAADGIAACVVTVCGGPPRASSLSSYARSLHARWSGTGSSPCATSDLTSAAIEMVERRRAEDVAALHRLGCSGIVLDMPDAIYRRSPVTGDWLYVGDDAIFGKLSQDEGPMVDEIAERLLSLGGLHPTTKVLVPLTVGSHVDHQLVRRAAETAWDSRLIGYYEDYPYSGDERLLNNFVGGEAVSGGTAGGASAVGAIAVCGSPDPGAGLVASHTPLAPVDLTAKIEAVACYESQISTFWTSAQEMTLAVTEFALSRGVRGRPSERTWRRATL